MMNLKAYIITSLKKNTNFCQNISIPPEHQSSMDCLKYINSLKNSVVSGFNCILASLWEYDDSFLKYQAKTCKSYIRDTYH